MLYVHGLVGQMGLRETHSRPKSFGTYTRHGKVGNKWTEMVIRVDLPYAAKEPLIYGYGCLFLQLRSHPVTAAFMSCPRKCKCRL